MAELAYARALFQWVRDRVHNGESDRGSVPEWVIIVAFGALIAAAVGGIYLAKFKTKATQLNLNTP